jgi:hypothetical protein
MTQESPLARDIRLAAAQVQSDEPSTTNWGPVTDLIAEALHLGEGAVYAATVSKPGNLSVRMSQSDDARDADVFVAMYTGDRKIIQSCVESAVKRARRQGRQLVLVFADLGAGMKLAAAVKQPTDSIPSALAQAFDAPWIDC